MLRQLLSTTRGVGGRDMLPDPLDQVDQFNALCEKLSDEDFKKRMVLSFIYNLFIIYYIKVTKRIFFTDESLRSVGGPDSARRILVKVGTNNLWSSYSSKGRRGKTAFKGTAVCRVIKSKCDREICFFYVQNSGDLHYQVHILS